MSSPFSAFQLAAPSVRHPASDEPVNRLSAWKSGGLGACP
jgi:hypothetical protein